MLNAGETVDMPVFFFIDPDFVTDPAMHNVNDITLSYTFFSKFIMACSGYLPWFLRRMVADDFANRGAL